MKNDHEIIVKCKWGSGYAVSSAAGSWLSPGGVSGGKTHENFWPFFIFRTNEKLKIGKNKQANLF